LSLPLPHQPPHRPRPPNPRRALAPLISQLASNAPYDASSQEEEEEVAEEEEEEEDHRVHLTLMFPNNPLNKPKM